MLGYLDWIIILIAFAAALGALYLLRPQNHKEDSQHILSIRREAEEQRKKIAQTLQIVEHGAQDAQNILRELKAQTEQTKREYTAGRAHAEQAEHVLERVQKAEYEMRDISTQLGDRLQHLQAYWDEQLTDSVESVKKLRTKLNEGLGQVDEGMTRLREQEKMAQSFTRRLLAHHQEQAKTQQENARLSTEVHSHLENMLKESTHLLNQMKNYQHQADTVFKHFSEEMNTLESQASEQFTSLFQTTDLARHELNAGLEETRHHVETMRHREVQSSELSRTIQQRFEQIDHIRVERIGKTLDLTDQMSSDLQQGVNNARHLLSTLERAVQDVASSLHTPEQDAPTPSLDLREDNDSDFLDLPIDDATDLPAAEENSPPTEAESNGQNTVMLHQTTSPKPEPGEDSNNRNLFTLRAYR